MKAIDEACKLLQRERDALLESESGPGSGPVYSTPAQLHDDVLEDLMDYDEAIAALRLMEEALLPQAKLRTFDSDYLSGLIIKSHMSTRAVARQIGIDDGELRGYLSGRRAWPYPVQFAIELLSMSGGVQKE